jgi:hypothetical protein
MSDISAEVYEANSSVVCANVLKESAAKNRTEARKDLFKCVMIAKFRTV